MDPFKLGLRTVLGVMLPGTVLVLVLCFAFLTIAFFLDEPLTNLAWLKDQQFLSLLVLFLVSYFLGSMMRLNAADEVDKKSQEYCLVTWRTKHDPSGELEKQFECARQQLLAGERDLSDVPEGFDSWVWRRESFPYPLWQFRKLHLYHPHEVYRFYQRYRECIFGRGVAGRGKEFFNYCKMVIRHASQESGSAVLQEVNFAEGTVRFYAGTYYGLVISIWIVLSLLLFCTF